jgi:hypothetical protein
MIINLNGQMKMQMSIIWRAFGFACVVLSPFEVLWLWEQNLSLVIRIQILAVALTAVQNSGNRSGQMLHRNDIASPPRSACKPGWWVSGFVLSYLLSNILHPMRVDSAMAVRIFLMCCPTQAKVSSI